MDSENDKFCVIQDPDSGIYTILNRKNRPGRPRASIRPPPIAMIGNSTQPTNPTFRCEILFAHNIVKTVSNIIHALLKQQLEYVVLRFEHNGLYILHNVREDSRQVYPPMINIFYAADAIHYYYCETPTNLCIQLQQLRTALDISHTTTTYIHMIVPITSTSIAQNSELYNGILKIRIHSPSNNLATYCEKNIQSVMDYQLSHNTVLVSSHYNLDFWLSNKHLKNMIKKQKDGYLVIQKVGNGKIVVQVMEGSQPSEFFIPENAMNVININLYPQQVIFSTTKLSAISDLIHTIDPPNDRMYLKTHITEPPILGYRIENTECDDNRIACYIDFRVPLISQIT
jgi:hypothetical protein